MSYKLKTLKSLALFTSLSTVLLQAGDVGASTGASTGAPAGFKSKVSTRIANLASVIKIPGVPSAPGVVSIPSSSSKKTSLELKLGKISDDRKGAIAGLFGGPRIHPGSSIASSSKATSAPAPKVKASVALAGLFGGPRSIPSYSGVAKDFSSSETLAVREVKTPASFEAATESPIAINPLNRSSIKNVNLEASVNILELIDFKPESGAKFTINPMKGDISFSRVTGTREVIVRGTVKTVTEYETPITLFHPTTKKPLKKDDMFLDDKGNIILSGENAGYLKNPKTGSILKFGDVIDVGGPSEATMLSGAASLKKTETFLDKTSEEKELTPQEQINSLKNDIESINAQLKNPSLDDKKKHELEISRATKRRKIKSTEDSLVRATSDGEATSDLSLTPKKTPKIAPEVISGGGMSFNLGLIRRASSLRAKETKDDSNFDDAFAASSESKGPKETKKEYSHNPMFEGSSLEDLNKQKTEFGNYEANLKNLKSKKQAKARNEADVKKAQTEYNNARGNKKQSAEADLKNRKNLLEKTELEIATLTSQIEKFRSKNGDITEKKTLLEKQITFLLAQESKKRTAEALRIKEEKELARVEEAKKVEAKKNTGPTKKTADISTESLTEITELTLKIDNSNQTIAHLEKLQSAAETNREKVLKGDFTDSDSDSGSDSEFTDSDEEKPVKKAVTKKKLLETKKTEKLIELEIAFRKRQQQIENEKGKVKKLELELKEKEVPLYSASFSSLSSGTTDSPDPSMISPSSSDKADFDYEKIFEDSTSIDDANPAADPELKHASIYKKPEETFSYSSHDATSKKTANPLTSGVYLDTSSVISDTNPYVKDHNRSHGIAKTISSKASTKDLVASFGLVSDDNNVKDYINNLGYNNKDACVDFVGIEVERLGNIKHQSREELVKLETAKKALALLEGRSDDSSFLSGITDSSLTPVTPSEPETTSSKTPSWTKIKLKKVESPIKTSDTSGAIAGKDKVEETTTTLSPKKSASDLSTSGSPARPSDIKSADTSSEKMLVKKLFGVKLKPVVSPIKPREALEDTIASNSVSKKVVFKRLTGSEMLVEASITTDSALPSGAEISSSFDGETVTASPKRKSGTKSSLKIAPVDPAVTTPPAKKPALPTGLLSAITSRASKKSEKSEAAVAPVVPAPAVEDPEVFEALVRLFEAPVVAPVVAAAPADPAAPAAPLVDPARLREERLEAERRAEEEPEPEAEPGPGPVPGAPVVAAPAPVVAAPAPVVAAPAPVVAAPAPVVAAPAPVVAAPAPVVAAPAPGGPGLVPGAPGAPAPVPGAPGAPAPVPGAPVVAPVAPTKEEAVKHSSEEFVKNLSHEEKKDILQKILTTYSEIQAKSEAQAKQRPNISSHVLTSVIGNIHSRLDNIGFGQMPIGVASGSENIPSILNNVWASGLYGISKSSQSKDTSYKGVVYGPTIGVDFNVNESNILGFSYSKIVSNFKFKGQVGRKIDSETHVFSVYSQSSFSENFVLSNIASFSASKINSKRPGATSLTTSREAIGKYSAKSQTLETILGYNKALTENVSIMPNAGLRFTNYTESAHKEIGLGIQNLEVASKSEFKTVGLLGAKLIMSKDLGQGVEIMPSIDFGIENHFNNKSKNAKTKFAYNDKYFESTYSKVAKIQYNLGAGVSVRKDSVELSLSYNANLYKKYENHQGSLKLKVMF